MLFKICCKNIINVVILSLLLEAISRTSNSNLQTGYIMKDSDTIDRALID